MYKECLVLVYAALDTIQRNSCSLVMPTYRGAATFIQLSNLLYLDKKLGSPVLC